MVSRKSSLPISPPYRYGGWTHIREVEATPPMADRSQLWRPWTFDKRGPTASIGPIASSVELVDGTRLSTTDFPQRRRWSRPMLRPLEWSFVGCANLSFATTAKRPGAAYFVDLLRGGLPDHSALTAALCS